MRRPVTTFVRHNGIKALLTAEQGVKAISGGKIGKNLFDVEPKYVGSDVRIMKETDDATYIAKIGADRKISNGEFKILVTTDLHLCDDMNKIRKSLQMLARHVAAEKPDLILFTGDIVLTDFQQIDAIQFGRFMEKMGVYWAYVFGNHEARDEKEYHKYFMMKNFSSFPHCLSKFGDPNLFGYGNFAIHIMNSEDTVQQSLYFLDSGRDIIDKYRPEYNIPDEMGSYDFLKNNQIDWYSDSVKAINSEYGETKSMMFMHIPLCEYKEAMEFNEETGVGTPTGKAEILYGSMYESVGCSQYNSGMFAKIKELGSTQAVFAGHDHVNDYCALYEGVYLIYAQCDGYDTYTLEEKTGWDETKWMQGVTMVDLHADGSVDFRQRFNRDYL